MRLTIAAACAALCAYAGSANAEAFTFVNTNAAPNQVMLHAPNNPDGRPMGATVYSIKTIVTFADGKKADASAQCANWVLPPDSQFGQSGVCEYKEGGGPLYETRFTCAAPTKGGDGIECWGTLTGTGGAWKGRSGAFTAHANQTGAKGEGHWN